MAENDSPPLTIVFWLWRGHQGSATRYVPEHANIAARMVHRNLTLKHRIVLLTDHLQADYDPLLEVVPLWDDWRELKNPFWRSEGPQCYVRLKAFSREAREILGERFVSIDLDCVVVSNLDPLFDRSEDFLIYHRPEMREQDRAMVYQGSMWMMRAGAREQVWTDFHGLKSIEAAREWIGTDQAWIRHRLGPDEPGWTDKDGVYGWHWIAADRRWLNAPPPNARIIFFNTRQKPWEFAAVDLPRCANCGHPVRVKPPYEITFNKRGASNTYQWIPRLYH